MSPTSRPARIAHLHRCKEARYVLTDNPAGRAKIRRGHNLRILHEGGSHHGANCDLPALLG